MVAALFFKSGSERPAPRNGMHMLGAALAGCLLSPAMALADAAAAATDKAPDSVFAAKNLWYVAGVAAGGLIGWLGKLLADNINGTLAKRRDFVTQTTGQITTLAKDHYWALANHAGLLAGMLEEYLMVVDLHLLLEWENPGDLASLLKQKAEICSYQTFYSLCRLIQLFDKFQFEQSNTYLLTSDIAGRSCRQLYNSFVMSLPISEDGAARLDTLAILDVMTRPIAVSGRPNPVAGTELTEAEFNELHADIDGQTPPAAEDPRVTKLREARGAYREWLGGRLDLVCTAAQYLRAYNELLELELARLYRDWFPRVPNSKLAEAEVAAYRGWLDTLTEESVDAISRARTGSELLQALGSGSPKARQRPRPKTGGDAVKHSPSPVSQVLDPQPQ